MILARVTKPAVSLLKIRFPKVIDCTPYSVAKFTSSSVKPPSGPINTPIDLQFNDCNYSLI